LAKIAYFLKSLKSQKKWKNWLFYIKVKIFFIKNTYSIVKYYLNSIKKVLTQKCKILKNDCLLCYSKTLWATFVKLFPNLRLQMVTSSLYSWQSFSLSTRPQKITTNLSINCERLPFMIQIHPFSIFDIQKFWESKMALFSSTEKQGSQTCTTKTNFGFDYLSLHRSL